jgi:hypothetical protein
MNKKPARTPLLSRPKRQTLVSPELGLLRRASLPKLWLWLGTIMVVGLLIVVIVSLSAGLWIRNVQLPISMTQSTPTPTITTFPVGRTATYAGLNMTVVNAQYATAFANDDIHSGTAVVRLNMRIATTTSAPVKVLYYDIARLLAPKLNPIAPTNVHLSTGPSPGAVETGWMDFAVTTTFKLDMLTLQLGSMVFNESLVKIPFTGPFDASRYADRHSRQPASFSYIFGGNTLIYHLLSIDIRFAYQGNQARAGQQFYILNFTVENPQGVDVSPGFGFDYVRLVINGVNRPPIDNSLPYTFKANAKTVGGHTVYAAPAGLKTLTIGFLSQNGNGQENFDVGL